MNEKKSLSSKGPSDEKIQNTYEKKSFSYVITPHSLKAKVFTYLLQGGKKISETIEEKEFPLKKITPKELLIHRKSKNRGGFILKIGDSYFYSEIPIAFRFAAQHFAFEGFKYSNYKHLCSQECKRFLAAEDCDGGCAKVRDIPISILIKEEGYNSSETLEKSLRIEKYPFIQFGFESFNTKSNAIFVLCCTHFKK